MLHKDENGSLSISNFVVAVVNDNDVCMFCCFCCFFQAAFLLPILQQLMTDGVAASKFSEVQEPEAIIVAPTRELINQIYLEARKFAYGYISFASDRWLL